VNACHLSEPTLHFTHSTVYYMCVGGKMESVDLETGVTLHTGMMN